MFVIFVTFYHSIIFVTHSNILHILSLFTRTSEWRYILGGEWGRCLPATVCHHDFTQCHPARPYLYFLVFVFVVVVICQSSPSLFFMVTVGLWAIEVRSHLGETVAATIEKSSANKMIHQSFFQLAQSTYTRSTGFLHSQRLKVHNFFLKLD